MESLSGQTKTTSSTTMIRPLRLPKSASVTSLQTACSSFSPITNRSSPLFSPVTDPLSQAEAESLQKQRRSEQTVVKILDYCPQKQTLSVDAGVAAYFGHLFQTLRSS